MTNEAIAKYLVLCPFAVEGRCRRANWYQRWCKYQNEHQQALVSYFGILAWELVPQSTRGLLATSAHPWLKRLYEDLGAFALISSEFEDIRVSIDGSYMFLFDQRHEEAVH